jgi:hypothetical protein
MPAFAGRSPRPAPRPLRRLRRFLDGDEAQSKRQAGFAFDPDRPIDPSVRGAVPEFGQNIDRLAIGIAPTGIPPGLAFDGRDPIPCLAAFLVRSCEAAETFGGKIKGAGDAPQPIFRLGDRTYFRDSRAIDDPDQPAVRRLGRSNRGKRLRRGATGQRRPGQQGEPIATLTQTMTQTIEPRHVGNIDEPDSRAPCRC